MPQKKLTRKLGFKLPTAILGASFFNEDQSMVAGCMDGVYMANLRDKSFERIGVHESYVSSVAYLKKQNAFVTAGYDGVVQWFDLESKLSTRKVKAHEFWSWDMAVSPHHDLVASVTGQYLAGGYKYEPAPEREPSVKLFGAESGELLHSFTHVPSVQAVAFSHDNRLVAAGNLMGEVRIWECDSGKQIASFTSPDFTSWGVIKSHCYLGGVFAIRFTPDDKALLIAGMGPMHDPMAGNGRQLWQKWAWQESPPKKLDETHGGESGEGLMETIAMHPSGEFFAMGGRLRGGDWNLALFELNSGVRMGTIKSGFRVTECQFTSDGKQLVVVGTQGQPESHQDGVFPHFGRVEVYDIEDMG